MKALHGFEGFDLAHLVDVQARSRGAHPFLVWAPFDAPEQRWSYAEFADAVARLAGALARRGIRLGDRLLIHLDNSPEGVITWFACARLGATAVVTNARASGEELAYYVEHSQVTAAVTQPKLLPIVETHCAGLRWVAVTATDNGTPPPSGRPPSRSLSFETLLAECSPAPLRAPDPELTVSVQYTSGTTSRPKGVVFTHANGLWGAKTGSMHAGLRDTDVFLIHLPLYHVIAQNYALLPALWAGSTVVLVPRFSSSRFWDVSVRHRCTWTSMVAFCVKALGGFEVPAIHHYRAWGNGFWSAKIERRYRLSLLGWWGMTELVTHPVVGDLGKVGREMAIGRPAPGYDLMIRADDGRPCDPGEVGNLSVRGRAGVSIFKEYLDDPAATTASFDAHGFFLTGDRVVRHADGFIEYVERAKDMLKVGGENVGAAEIERVIMNVPGVREAAVVGRSDLMRGEVPVAFVVAAEGSNPASPDIREAVLTACRGRLADFKVPREVILLDALPRGSMHKISKVELRRKLPTGDAP